MGEQYTDSPVNGTAEDFTFVDNQTVMVEVEKDGTIYKEFYTFESGEQL